MLGAVACRRQTQAVTVPTGQFGAGTGYTASCNGDFPSWISENPPVPDASGDINPNEPGIQKAFELAQSYPLGVPVLVGNKVDHYDPPSPNIDAPWRVWSNLSDATQRTNYLNALKAYILENMSDADVQFDATRNNRNLSHRGWYHVPMMTAAGTRRREPYHGMTAERVLRPSEQTHWLNAGPGLRAFAIGYYNPLGGYTIGQVFKSSDLSQTDPTQAKFIDGALVFKLLFAEYIPSRIIAPDPLANSPSWWVQDPANPAAPIFETRLLQVDVAVKDDHFASTTGWVFGTFVYDEALAATEPNPWKRLTPVGLMWGNDPSVTGPSGTLAETWINPALPAAFVGHLGRAGRLIGPIDDPASSCLSCHSTAQVDPSQAGHMPQYSGAATKPPNGCVDPMDWFRNLPSGTAGATPFGRGLSCPVDPSAAGLISTDYSLQIQEGVAAVYGFNNANPCVGVSGPALSQALRAPATSGSSGMRSGMARLHFRNVLREPAPVKVSAERQVVGPTPPDFLSR